MGFLEVAEVADSLPTVLSERVLHVLGSVADFQIGMVLSFAGNVDPELLQQAVGLSLETVPHLKCRFNPVYIGAQWEQILSLTPDDYFQVKAKSQANDVIEYFADPIDHQVGPQVHALLLTGDQDTLCLKIAHHAADAGGVKEYAYLLSEIYSRLHKGIGFHPADYGLGRRDLGQVIETFPLLKRWKILLRTARDLLSHSPFQRPVSIPGKEADLSGRTYYIYHVSKDLFRSITTWAQAHGFTLNDVLMAASQRVLHRMNDYRTEYAHRLVVTADLRRNLPAETSPVIANLSGWVLTTLGKKLGTTFYDTCHYVHQCMNIQKTDHLGLGLFPVLALLDWLLPLSWEVKGFAHISAKATRQGFVAPSFTNMGIIDAKRLDFGTVTVEDAYLIPPIVYPPVFGFGVSSYCDSLTFSCGYCSPGFTTETIKIFFHNLESELHMAQ
jgi:NRPS condensation-like uncharacterized protein